MMSEFASYIIDLIGEDEKLRALFREKLADALQRKSFDQVLDEAVNRVVDSVSKSLAEDDDIYDMVAAYARTAVKHHLTVLGNSGMSVRVPKGKRL